MQFCAYLKGKFGLKTVKFQFVIYNTQTALKKRKKKKGKKKREKNEEKNEEKKKNRNSDLNRRNITPVNNKCS